MKLLMCHGGNNATNLKQNKKLSIEWARHRKV
jgi:hypothetical protein